MGAQLWFARTVDIGYSSPHETRRPTSQLIDFTVCTSLELTDGAAAAFSDVAWVEQANLLGKRGGHWRLQLIVRCRELPPQLGGAGTQEALKAEILRLIRGW